MDAVTMAVWASMVLEGLSLLERLAAVKRRADAGETVTEADLDRARAENVAAVNRWEAARPRSSEPGGEPEAPGVAEPPAE